MFSIEGFRQYGFSLFELIVVVVIISLVSAVGAKYYIDLREEALRTGLETEAHIFAGVIQVARAEWLLSNPVQDIPTEPGSKLSVDLGGNLVYVNEFGWPANSSPELDSSTLSQTAAECSELWRKLVKSPASVSIHGLERFSVDEEEQRYHVSSGSAVCRYELIEQLDEKYFFEYNLKTGNVLSKSTIAE